MEGWDDAAVAPRSSALISARFESLMEEYGYHGILRALGHGCIHMRVSCDLQSKAVFGSTPNL